MKRYNITVNGVTYDVAVEDNNSGAPVAPAAPAAAAPCARSRSSSRPCRSGPRSRSSRFRENQRPHARHYPGCQGERR